MPWQICSDCLDKCHYIRSFRDMCLANEELLQSAAQLKDPEDEEVEEIVEEEIIIPSGFDLIDEQDPGIDDVESRGQVIDDEVLGQCFQEEVELMEWHTGQEVGAIEEEEEGSTKVTTKSTTKRLGSSKSPLGEASKPIQCESCPKILKDQHNYARHRLRHNIGRPHACPQCHTSFVFKNDLELHLKSHDPVNYKFVCTKCDPPVKYFLKRSLKAHEMRNHQHRERNELCLECGKRFFDVSALKKHSLIHYQKSYECEKCYIRFTRVDHLKKHMETHQRNDTARTGGEGS